MIRKNDLIKILQKIKGNPVIIMATDAEGNDYSPLSNVEDEIDNKTIYYYAETTWNGQIHESECLDEIEKTNGEYIECIVLEPVN